MQTITEQEWQTLPEPAQQECYDFFLFLKQRYSQPVPANSKIKNTVNSVAEQLADLGGSEPQLEDIPRRREI